MDKGVWWAIVHGIAKNWTRLSDQAQHHIPGKHEPLSPSRKCTLKAEMLIFLLMVYIHGFSEDFLMNISFYKFIVLTIRHINGFDREFS